MVVTADKTFEEYAASAKRRIEDALDKYTDFAAEPNDHGHFCPARLKEAIRYSVQAPGKRLRPLLVLFAAEACGANIDVALPAACAVEFVHTYSLIHDDLPCMDDDDLRRGRPTCHKVYGEATAILAGDGLLALAFDVLATQVRPAPIAAACCAALARAAGPAALVGGQMDDLMAQDSASPATIEQLEAIHARKTAAMLVVALQLGGLCAQAGGDQLAALESYGQHLGLAFQIMDDLLDVRGDEAVLGKRVRKDAHRGKLTYPALLGVVESQQRAAAHVGTACQALAPLAPRAGGLEALARFVLERDR